MNTIESYSNSREELRAEELIIHIYKNKVVLGDRGIRASRIVMSMESYNKIRKYHLGLGEIQGYWGDYITEDEIFGIPVFIDTIRGIKVE